MPSSHEVDNLDLNFGCLCKTHTYTHPIPKSSLPLKATVCHCDSCRHLTGALYSITVNLPKPYDSIDLSRFSTYTFSQRLLVHFCATCSSPIFFHDIEKDILGVFTGTLPNLEGLVSYRVHIFIGDTKDGGASVWMKAPNTKTDDAKLKLWNNRHEHKKGQLPEDWLNVSSLPSWDTKLGPDTIPIRCHCGGVDLRLNRWGAKKSTSPSENEIPWCVDPKSHKYLAALDACNTCRLFFGIDLVYWAYAPYSHLSYADGSPIPSSYDALHAAVMATDKDPRLGTLKQYKSSEDVYRYFCSKCSASILWTVEERQDVLDVAIGVLHAPDGARAECYLSWRFGEVGFPEDMAGGWREGLAETAEKESEEFRVVRGLERNWTRKN